MVIAEQSILLQSKIFGIMLLIMLLNYLGMFFANQIINIVGMPLLRLIGWIFAVMQSPSPMCS